MNNEIARSNMVEQQIRPWKCFAVDTLELLQIVKRENYVPAALRGLAFADTALPLGFEASMFEPKLEALALSALALKPHEKVLEIGAGSGFMASLLAQHADHVWSLELVPELAAMARANLQANGVDNVTVELRDGLDGLPEQAPFDAIMVSGAVAEIPAALLYQLKPGGRLFAVVGKAPVMSAQLLTRTGDADFRTQSLCETMLPYLRQARQPTAFAF